MLLKFQTHHLEVHGNFGFQFYFFYFLFFYLLLREQTKGRGQFKTFSVGHIKVDS